MAAVIDAITTVRTNSASDEDGWFVRAASGQDTGWYGPINGAQASIVRDQLAEAAIGYPVAEHKELYGALADSIDECRCLAASWALGSVDCAVWDLHARAEDTQVATLINPAASPTVRLYASWLRLDVSDPASGPVITNVGRAGWLFTKWGLRRRSGAVREPEASRLAAVTDFVAATLGTAAAFDAVFTWDQQLGVHFADLVNNDNLLWLEDPLPQHDVGAYCRLARATPLAIGERLTHYDGGPELFSIPLRAFTIDVVGCGGLTRAIDLVRTAVVQGVPVYPHGRSFVPALHLAAAHPGAIPAVEYRLQWEPQRQAGYAHPWTPENGTIELPGRPGLGASPRSH